MFNRPIILIILDGYGINNNSKGNAIVASDTPNIKNLIEAFPNTIIHTSGLDVGLPEGQMGNSEVGHMNIGAGRVVYQDLTRISKAVKDGTFYENRAFLSAIENCKVNNSGLHIFGLVSDGGVHSHINHLYALLRLAKEKGLSKVFIHCFLDGRDVPPVSGKEYVEALESNIRDIGIGKIATVMGRYYAMDRDKRWDRVELAYNAMTKGVGEYALSAIEGIEQSYNLGVTDEFVKPIVVVEDSKPVATISENDSVIFFNFRSDRAREITRAFVDQDFDGFNREKGKFPLKYLCMTEYDETIKDVEIAFEPQNLNNTFGEYISELGYSQLRIAETEKYAHVTFFFNGGVETVYQNEDRALIPSPKVATYDLKPEMSAFEVTDEVVNKINTGKYNFILLNYANCDMVGHTGFFDAAKTAVSTVDQCVGRVVDAMTLQDGIVIITADHGNAEQMIDYNTGEPYTAHTTNVVPFILVGVGNVKLSEGRLCDIAPTILDLMSEKIPEEMTGKSLIEK